MISWSVVRFLLSPDPQNQCRFSLRHGWLEASLVKAPHPSGDWAQPPRLISFDAVLGSEGRRRDCHASHEGGGLEDGGWEANRAQI